MSESVLTGRHWMTGEEACAEGALAAGCQFFAGYPSAPSLGVADRMARRLPGVGGTYVQMEDAAGAISSVVGASWAGAKAMTATCGTGIGLMQEEISYAVATETPCVIVDVQREGRRGGRWRTWSSPVAGRTGRTRSWCSLRRLRRRCST